MANLPRSPRFRPFPQAGNSARSYVLAALVIGGVTTLSIAAWPLPPFLWELLPERSRDLLGQVPARRAWAAALALAALLAAAAMGRFWGFLPTGLGWRILGAWSVAVLLVALIVAALWLVLGLPGLDTTPTVSPKALDSIATRAFAIVAGLGGVALLVIAYQRQSGEQTRLFTERFTTAVAQLGEDQPAVRLGGVHALAHLADDAPTPALRQMCVDVLCAYLRNPSPDDLPQGSTDDQKQTHHDRVVEHAAMREVRLTIARTISHRLRTPTPWQDCDYDFTNVTFESALDLAGVVCRGHMTFLKTNFTRGADFRNATFTRGDADFGGATFTRGDADFRNATFNSRVDFGGATFTRGADFGGATFNSRVDFGGATFTRGDADFRNATFNSRVDFGGATFTRGGADFRNATFTRGADFGGATFTGDASFVDATFTRGGADFRNATFTRGADFGGATFTGDADFGGATFGDATFNSRAYFGRVTFTESAYFGSVNFTGEADFSGAAFQRTADFVGDGTARGTAKGVCPIGLLAAAEASEGTVRLPRRWTHPRRVRLKNPPPVTDTPAPPEQDEEP